MPFNSNLPNNRNIGRRRFLPGSGGPNHADFVRAKPMGRPQDRGSCRAARRRDALPRVPNQCWVHHLSSPKGTCVRFQPSLWRSVPRRSHLA